MLIMWLIFFPPPWVTTVTVAVVFHELAHLFACKIMGVRVLTVKALPWGLTAATPLMYEPFAQFVISLSGPMCNFFLLFFCPVIRVLFSKEVSDLFALANLADGLLNLLPALPLDGGIMLKAFLCAHLGLVRGFSYMLKVTAVVGIILMMFGFYVFTSASSNASYIVAGIFILYNLKHEKQLILCIRKRILTGEIISKPRTKKIYASPSSNAICFVDRISPTHTMQIHIAKAVINQDRLIECVLKNSMITLGECIEKK